MSGSDYRCDLERQKSLRLIAQPAAEMIRRDAAVTVAQRQDEPPPMKRPGRVAMHEEQRFRLPAIE